MNEVYSFQVTVAGKPDWGRIVDAPTEGKAKAEYWRDLQDAWDVPYTAIRAHKLGRVDTSDPGPEAWTPKQVELARHALGLPNKSNTTNRNHFCTGEGGSDYPAWFWLALIFDREGFWQTFGHSGMPGWKITPLVALSKLIFKIRMLGFDIRRWRQRRQAERVVYDDDIPF